MSRGHASDRRTEPLQGPIERQAEADGGVEIVGLSGGAEGALQADRRQRPGIAADGVLAEDGILGLGLGIIERVGPLGGSARQVVDAAPRRLVLSEPSSFKASMRFRPW